MITVPSYQNVLLTRIYGEYMRPRPNPVTLFEVAELFGFPYFDFCMWLRENALSRSDFRLHIRTAREAKILKQDNSQYLLDYYLVTGYSYDIIAIIFNYEGGANVHRAIKKCPVYVARIKGVAPHKKTCRPKMIEFELDMCRATAFSVISTHRLNRICYRAMELKVPVRRSWQMDVAKTSTVYFFEPIFNLLNGHCRLNDYNFHKFVNMAIIQEKIPGAADTWIARPSAIVKQSKGTKPHGM